MAKSQWLPIGRYLSRTPKQFPPDRPVSTFSSTFSKTQRRAPAQQGNMYFSERSYEKIARPDLRKLLKYAHQDREDFFEHNPKWRKLYATRIMCIALCQGAALHYVDGENGISDFDVWTFYYEHSKGPYPHRRRGEKDFGISKFGCHPMDSDNFDGRRIDLIGRSLKVRKRTDPIKTIRQYLSEPRTKSAKELSQKAVVFLTPEKYMGKIIWPETA